MPGSVIVVGSGAAGLAAALAAREAGAAVTVLEATTSVGGTTALSSGAVWVPGNHVRQSSAPLDSADRAHRYLRSLAAGDTDLAVCDRFVDAAPRVLRWLEDVTALRWSALPFPDCHSDLPGGAAEGGRSVEPQPLRAPASVTALVRPPLPWRLAATLTEMATGRISPEVVDERRRTGTATLGQALVAGLLAAAVAAGVEVRTSARAEGFVSDDRDGRGGVTAGGERLRGRVVLGSGGFERDPGLVAAFLRAPVRGVIGAPGARGDGLRMAISVGAALGNMAEAWWCPAMHAPGDSMEGEPLYRMLFAERARPGAIMVDAAGRRFANEAQNYNDLGRALTSFDSSGFRFGRNPSWLVFDAPHRASYPVGPVLPGAPDPPWLARGETVAELAKHMDVPAETLAWTVERFNTAARDGSDPDFGRGTGAYDRAMGDRLAPHPTLRPLAEGPFYAVPVHAGLGGTKGGPRTDGDGRVLHIDGGPVPGLYAAGNAAASPFGYAYPGTGTTLGQALTFGALAGKAAATD
ncbi:FAD-dependent oxidoreductase (plasmid) [Embleya sp. NBC_00888]|uniref:FAD-dependent oxidoreductase n=1 Tax=Embleya sp. NBC_00888 TaxID=2975960 RepID=UPI002F90FDAD|nr:FAD-dependent oxidoreductase [Embleya sp. NBC_00888]